MITILFFARLREQLSTDSIQISSSANLTTGDILNQLAQTDKIWRDILTKDSILVAVNQEITNWTQQVNDGDEIAFFPPVTGG